MGQIGNWAVESRVGEGLEDTVVWIERSAEVLKQPVQILFFVGIAADPVRDVQGGLDDTRREIAADLIFRNLYGRLYNKKCDERGSKVIGIKDSVTFLT